MISKVVVGRPLIDLTEDTVTPEVLCAGYTAHDAAGNLIVGTMDGDPVGDCVLPDSEELAVNKVVFGDTVLIDLSSDTVAPQVLAMGYTAHCANGQAIVGIWEPQSRGFTFPFDNGSLTEPKLEFIREE